MNKLSLHPLHLLLAGASAAALLTYAVWSLSTGSFQSHVSPIQTPASHQSLWNHSTGHSGYHPLATMSEAERAAFIRQQLATANGRMFP